MLVTSTQDIDRIINMVGSAGGVVLDTETSSLHPMRDGDILAGVAVRPLVREQGVFYVPVAHEDYAGPQATRADVTRLLEACHGKTQVYHNAPFDVEVIYQFGVDFTHDRLADMMVMTRLVHEDLPSYKLKDLGVRFIDPRAKDQEHELKAYMRKYHLQRYSQIPPPIIEPYACQDAILTEGLLREFKPEIDGRGLTDLLRMESRLTNTLIRMEIAGVRVDLDYVRDAIEDINAALIALERESYRIAGHEFNIDSPKQLGEVFHAMGVHSAKQTNSGGESWDIIALALIDHPLARYVRMFRTYRKLRGTYLENYIDLADPNSLLHCRFRQSGTRTGRMSCVPLDTEILTKTGWKAYEGLRLHERVLGYDVVSRELKWTTVEGIHRERAPVGRLKLRETKNGSAVLRCTDEHMFVTETDHSVGFSMASRLPKKKRNYYGLRIAAGKPEAGVDSGIGDDYAALLGWAITDGSIAFTSAGRPYLGIGQKKPVGIMKLDAIGHLFDHRAAYRKSDGSEVVSFSMGVEATEIFMRCVGWWPDEPLVPVVMNMSSSERRAMFEAMVDADGSRRVRKYGRSRLPESLSFGAAESHKAVLDGDVEHVFTVLLALLGFGASYTYRRLHSGKRFTDISVLDQAMVHNYIYEPGEIEEEVWCPKTGTGTWVMRQGGKKIGRAHV